MGGPDSVREEALLEVMPRLDPSVDILNVDDIHCVPKTYAIPFYFSNNSVKK